MLRQPIPTGRVLALAAATAMVIGAPVLAAEETIRISGDSVPSDCGASKSATMAIQLSGSLTGCLAIFVQNFNCHVGNGFDYSVELGREEFDGSLDGRALAFNTIYTFNAVWPSGSCPSPQAEAEIAGGCTHWVSGDDVSGIIRFYDIIPTVGKGATNFLYEGTLTVGDSGSAELRPAARPNVELAETGLAAQAKSRAMAC